MKDVLLGFILIKSKFHFQLYRVFVRSPDYIYPSYFILFKQR